MFPMCARSIDSNNPGSFAGSSCHSGSQVLSGIKRVFPNQKLLRETLRRDLTPPCLSSLSASRDPDARGATSNSDFALCDSACRTHDTLSSAPPDNLCKRDLLDCPSCDSRGGPDRRLGSARCLLAVEGLRIQP